jgi:hypothetical protein
MTARRTEWATTLERRVVHATGALGLSSLVACGFGGGTLPLVPTGASNPGFKMLAPDAHARSCGAVLWPYGDRAGGDLMQRAVADLVAGHREADTIRDLHVSWRGVDLLVAQIGCLSARGDVGRTIPMVMLPHLHGGADGSHSE